MDLNLKGRVAFVTGGGAGIGETIARVLAGEGCTVWVADRDQSAAMRAAAAMARDGLSAHAVTVDVAEPAGVERVPGARRRQRLEPQGGQYARGAGVPRVGDHECPRALVQRPENLVFLLA